MDTKQSWKKIPRVWAGAILVILAILGVAAFFLLPRSQPSAANAAVSTQDPAIGPADAPVTIIEYGDFGCPTCKAWYQSGAIDKILAEYSGKVRFVWRDFPIITAQSPKAAEAGRCALEQDKFWPYHDLLYAKAPALSVDDLKAYAAQLGLDSAAFDTCLDSGKYQALVSKETRDARNRDFLGTPGFLINDKPYAGPPSYAYLKTQVDDILAAGG